MPTPLMGALSFASRVVPGAGAFELSRASRRHRVAVNVRGSPVAALDAKAETRWTEPPPFPEVSARFDATRRLVSPARDEKAAAAERAAPPKRRRDVFFRLAKFALAGSAVLGASLLVPRAALARANSPVAAAAATTKRVDKQYYPRARKAAASETASTKKGFFSLDASRDADEPAAVALARRAVPVAAALAAAYALYATRAFYEKALERSVKTLKRALEETAALRSELDATRAELDDVRAARDALTFQLGQSSAEVRSELQSAVLELAKTETELACARRELADAASLSSREAARARAEAASLRRTISEFEASETAPESDAAVADAERRVDRALERAVTTRVRFAISGVPAELARGAGDSAAPRVGIAGTWSEWSLDADDIVFLEPNDARSFVNDTESLVSADDADLVATLALRAGDAYEYKFVVARGSKNETLAVEWQPGPNRILVVPLPSPASVARGGDVVDTVVADDVWTGATTEWLGGHEHSPVTARARAAPAPADAGALARDFAETREARDRAAFAAVAEAPSNNITAADLHVADREVVDGVVVEGVPRDAGASKSHPR